MSRRALSANRRPTSSFTRWRGLGTPASLTAAVGDRPETDIACGQAAGLRTIAVLTGAGTAEAFAAMQPPPDWVFEDMIVLR